MKKLFICFIFLSGTMLLQAQVRRTPVQQQRTTQTAAKTFTLTNGKLGPIQTGQRFVNIPSSYAGLYDKYTRQTEKEYNEVEDFEITRVCYQFTKAGRNVFRVIMEGNVIGAIKLQEGSASIIKTQKGFHVGYAARTLYTKKSTDWFNIEGGTAACFDGNYTYEVSANDRVSLNPIESANDFKSNAKISSITYHN